MRVVGGDSEKGVIVGNTYDKYNSRNPIVKRMMDGFHSAIRDAVNSVSPRSIFEVGCGEGYWVNTWTEEGYKARGIDFSEKAIALAIEDAERRGLDPTVFSTGDIYKLDEKDRGDDLVVCCEVLEHLEDPEAGLSSLRKITDKYVLLSVPREPLWRFLNIARGKYLSDFGNTPGHLQHWSKRKFIDFVKSEFDIVKVYSPLPWTMVLCRSR